MNAIDQFFNQKLDELVYINLKDSTEFIDSSLPLPIVRDELYEGIKDGSFENQIKSDSIFKGMVYNISYDRDFKYCKEYVDILYASGENIDKYILLEGIKRIDNPQSAVNYFRTNYILKTDIKENSVYYAMCLRLIFSISYEEGLDFLLEEGRKLLNENIKDYPDHPISYLEFANYEILEENYIKASSYLKHASLLLDEYDVSDEQKNLIYQEIKRLDDLIEPYLKMDLAVEKLKTSPKKAIEILDSIGESPRGNYLKGKAYMNMDQMDKAIEFFELSESQDFTHVDLYNDFSLAYYNKGDYMGAIDTLDRGLKKHTDNEILLYNKAVMQLNKGDVDDAKESLSTLVSYDDVDEDIFNISMQLLEKLNLNND
ncbi:MAG: hypothetical protein SPI59_01480 [Finegoldia sp.]|nr:hypothetical protein [Finegoldia sp.]